MPESPAPPRVEEALQTRESAIFIVTPEEALVTVDGHPIGRAQEWDGSRDGKQYVFRGGGDHMVKLSLDGYETLWFKFTVTPDANRRVADIDVRMKRRAR